MSQHVYNKKWIWHGLHWFWKLMEMEMKDFRPISMVGCIYKIVRKVMTSLVGESQSALGGARIASEPFR